MKINGINKYMVLVLVLVMVLIAGGTYAWYVIGITDNSQYNGSSKCFTVNYSHGSDISGVIDMSSTYTGGKSTTITISVPASCTDVNAKIYLHTNSSSSYNFKLNQSSRNAAKVTLVKSGSNPVTTTLNGAEDLLLTSFDISAGGSATYTAYFWVDGAIAGDSWASASYSGYLYTTYTQK